MYSKGKEVAKFEDERSADKIEKFANDNARKNTGTNTASPTVPPIVISNNVVRKSIKNAVGNAVGNALKDAPRTLSVKELLEEPTAIPITEKLSGKNDRKNNNILVSQLKKSASKKVSSIKTPVAELTMTDERKTC
jgi:PKD repeat protein